MHTSSKNVVQDKNVVDQSKFKNTVDKMVTALESDNLDSRVDFSSIILKIDEYELCNEEMSVDVQELIDLLVDMLIDVGSIES